jgi:hypothetical protein
MNLKDDNAFRNAFNEAVKGLNKDQAQKMLGWFVVVAILFNILWYGAGAWITLLVVNVLFGPVVAVEFPQILAVAWLMYLIRHLTKADKS